MSSKWELMFEANLMSSKWELVMFAANLMSSKWELVMFSLKFSLLQHDTSRWFVQAKRMPHCGNHIE
jgi:hypothetical protein